MKYLNLPQLPVVAALPINSNTQPGRICVLSSNMHVYCDNGTTWDDLTAQGSGGSSSPPMAITAPSAATAPSVFATENIEYFFYATTALGYPADGWCRVQRTPSSQAYAPVIQELTPANHKYYSTKFVRAGTPLNGDAWDDWVMKGTWSMFNQSDFVTTSATFVDTPLQYGVPLIPFNMAITQRLLIKAYLRLLNTSTTIIPRIQIASTGSNPLLSITNIPSSATSNLVMSQNATPAGSFPAIANYLAIVESLHDVSPGTSPTIKIQLASETAGTSVRLVAGSVLSIERVTTALT